MYMDIWIYGDAGESNSKSVKSGNVEVYLFMNIYLRLDCNFSFFTCVPRELSYPAQGDDIEGGTTEEDVMAMMGFSGFGSTKVW